MAGWLTFFKERVPLVSFLFSSSGIAISTAVTAIGSPTPLTLFVIVGLTLFFISLRLMDDIKDVGKDRIAHPKRALAAGVISLRQAKAGVHLILAIQILFALLLHTTANATSSLTYLILTAYLYLMYREFFAGHYLSTRPLLYALTHQLVILPVTAFAMATISPDTLLSTETLALSALFFGGFFAYEVGRKFDPEAHPVLNTYRQVYGAPKAALFMIIAMLISFVGACVLSIWPYTLAVQLLCCTVPMTIAIGAPRSYKSVELIATLSLAFLIWVPIVLWR